MNTNDLTFIDMLGNVLKEDDKILYVKSQHGYLSHGTIKNLVPNGFEVLGRGNTKTGVIPFSFSTKRDDKTYEQSSIIKVT